MDKIMEYILEQTKQLLAIDSPTGYTKEASDYLLQEYRALGYQPAETVKGGVLVDLGGPEGENALLLEAHLDTLGAMVREVKED